MASVTITIEDFDDKVTVAASFNGPSPGMSTVYPSHRVALELLTMVTLAAEVGEGTDHGAN